MTYVVVYCYVIDVFFCVFLACIELPWVLITLYTLVNDVVVVESPLRCYNPRSLC